MMGRVARGAIALAGSLWLFSYLCTVGETVRAAGARTPKLLVLLVVDQMRADYIDRFQGQWSGGLKRLTTAGAWFRLAEYPYANTVTCAGHATIATGALPSTHGMILNGWFDRTSGSAVTCTSDSSVRNIGYAHDVKGGDSAARLLTPTLADELRAQLDPPGHSLAFSLKARSAITLGGHAPDAVAWFDDSGSWVTSTAFSNAPLPVVAQLLARNSVERDFDKTWNRSIAPGRYLFDATATGVTPPAGMTASFPHLLKGAGSVPDTRFYQNWQSSPYSDDYLARLAVDSARAFRFDSVGRVNLLAISFSALDKVGHDYGPNSHEVQDVLIRLDRTLGTLFEQLDATFGAGGYVVALSADHGVAPIPERAVAEALPAGRITKEKIVGAIEQVLQEELGPGPHVRALENTEVYLADRARERVAHDTAVVSRLRARVFTLPGIADLFTAAELEARPAGDVSVRGRYARSHYPGRSGDLTIVLRPYWLTDKTGTSHGSAYGYDTRVPVILMGAGIRPGEYLSQASPADIAPTLAHLAGVTLSHADGRVLAEALGSTADLDSVGR